MKQVVVLFPVLLFLFGVRASGMGVVSHWVEPAHGERAFEMTEERTKPVLVGDILYAANLQGEVYAIHRTDGYLFWHKQLTAGVEGALSYGRSKIVVGDLKGDLYALNARDGSESWTFHIDAEWLSPAAIAHEKIFVTTSNDELYALSENHGKEVWHYGHRGDEKMTIRGASSPAIYGDSLFVGFSDGSMAALTTGRGKVLWTRRLATKERFYDIDMTPYVDDRGVIVATFDGKLYSLDRFSGNSQWIFPVGSYGGFLVDDNKLYFAGLDGNFYALDRETSNVIWKTPFGTGVAVTPALAGGQLIFTASSEPNIYVVDPETGKIEWTENTGTATLAAPSGDPDGWFYCLSGYGNLLSFEILKGMTQLSGPKVTLAPSAVNRQWLLTKGHAT